MQGVGVVIKALQSLCGFLHCDAPANAWIPVDVLLNEKRHILFRKWQLVVLYIRHRQTHQHTCVMPRRGTEHCHVRLLHEWNIMHGQAREELRHIRYRSLAQDICRKLARRRPRPAF